MYLISNKHSKIEYTGRTIVHEFEIQYKKHRLIGQLIEVNDRIQRPVLRDLETGTEIFLSHKEEEEIFSMMFSINIKKGV